MQKEIFWVISDSDGNYYPNFCTRSKEESIETFEKYSMNDWEIMKKRGFKCVKVRFNPADLNNEFENRPQTANSLEN